VLYFEVWARELTKLTKQWTRTLLYRDARGNDLRLFKTKSTIPHLVPGVEIQVGGHEKRIRRTKRGPQQN
jgi:hypothetical protein